MISYTNHTTNIKNVNTVGGIFLMKNMMYIQMDIRFTLDFD